jgi:general stress protein YciG
MEEHTVNQKRVEGGKRSANTVKDKYGEEFFREMGRLGGQKSRGGGFAANRDKAREAGRLGGLKRKANFDAKKKENN